MRNTEWKRFERTVAKSFFAERNPLSGENSKHQTESDTLHPRLYIEAKRDRSYFPVKLIRLLSEVRGKAKKEGKIPVIALKEHNKEGFWLVVPSEYLVTIAEERDERFR